MIEGGIFVCFTFSFHQYLFVQDTVIGTCNTTYTFSDDGKGRFLLFKQRTQNECSNIPRVGFNTFGTTNCDGKSEDELQSTTQSYYRFSRGSGSASNTLKVNHISSFGYQIVQWYPPAGSPLYNRAKYALIHVLILFCIFPVLINK